jgi:hypothetical protein
MHKGRTQAVACGLGVFSIALGAAEVLFPRAIARAADARVSPGFVRLCGVREIITGIGILVAWNRAPWVWTRVAGDALDIAGTRRPAAIAALAGVTALDIATASALAREESAPPPRLFDYSDRSGFPRPVEQMRGLAKRRPEAQPVRV